MLDAATIEDHDRRHMAAVLGAPPAGRPVAAPLLLESAVAQEGHQPLARQRDVDVLQLGEPEIAALGDATGCIGVDMTAKRGFRPPIGPDGIGIEIADETRQAGIAQVVSLRLDWQHVAHQQVDRLDACDAVALPHDPAPRMAGQRVRRQVAGVGRHHVERPTGMTLRRLLVLVGLQSGTVPPHPLGVGHVHCQPHGRRCEAVCGAQEAINVGWRSSPALRHQQLRQLEDAQLCLW